MSTDSKNRGAASGSGIRAFLKDIEAFFHKRPVVYVDVGAHRGETFREVVGSELNVMRAYLIEPNPHSFAVLRDTVVELGTEALTVCYGAGLSDRVGQMQLSDLGSMSRVLDGVPHPEDGHLENALTIDVTTLDSMASSFPKGHVSILKIDVEGHELEVLRGADALLGSQSVDVLYLEAGLDPTNQQQTYYRRIDDALLAKGYRLFRIYEQVHEWLEDSPFLRRVNMAYMSRGFAERHPYRLLQELQALRREKDRRPDECSRRTASRNEDLQKEYDELMRARKADAEARAELQAAYDELTRAREADARASADALSRVENEHLIEVNNLRRRLSQTQAQMNRKITQMRSSTRWRVAERFERAYRKPRWRDLGLPFWLVRVVLSRPRGKAPARRRPKGKYKAG